MAIGSKRSWLITGCSSGFGNVLARALLARGEQVTVTARQSQTLADLVGKYPDTALAVSLDITNADAVEAAIKASLARFGRIDVLVNNAGYGVVGAVENTPLDSARAMMETNYFGTLSMIRGVLAHMIARRAGQIVNIGSVAGQVGFPLLAYYCASKFALAGMSESLAAELRPLGIAVTLAELGPFATEFTRNMAITPPAQHYDGAALSRVAGNAGWGAGDDPAAGVAALLVVLDAAQPPVRLILGQPGLDVASLHDERRATDRSKWLTASQLLAPGSDG
jgi:short-subunit dehydrogenase